MAKIRITENELKALIAENIEKAMLSEDWRDRQLNRAQNRTAKYNDAVNDYNLNQTNANKRRMMRLAGKNGVEFMAQLQSICKELGTSANDIQGTLNKARELNNIKKDYDAVVANYNNSMGQIKTALNLSGEQTGTLAEAENPDASLPAILSKIKELKDTVAAQSQKIRNLTAAANKQKAAQTTQQQANRNMAPLNQVNTPAQGQAQANTNPGLQK